MDSQAYGRSGDLSSSLYQPLDRERKEMRLLEVSPGNRGEIVKARLIYASLLNPEDIDYETISYAWGDATKLDDVNINGRVIDVPASSAAAIKCMRKLDTPRRLWIDAICINQDDLAERGHQVSIMSEIYKSSRQNLVYLGEEDETAENAFDSLRRVYQEIERKTNGKSGFRTKISQFSRGETEPIDCEFDEIAINALLKREWFKRLWVVQEVALAPSSICFCGSKLSIELVSVIRVLPWLRYHRQTTIDLMQAVGLWLVVEGKAKWSVCWLMVSTEHFLASELRDKIFAIAGLVPNPAENLRRPDPALISTDYSKPLSHVYRDATRYAIQEEGKLNVLQFVRHRCDGDELDLGEFPSWVPRLDIPFDKIYDPYPFVSNEFKADSNYQVPGYTIQCNYSGPETLSLVGYEVTCIRRASDVFSNTALRSPETCAAILRSIAEQYQTTKKILSIDEKSRYNSKDPVDLFPPVLASVLMGGTNSKDRLASDDELMEFQTFLNEFLNITNDAEKKTFFSVSCNRSWAAQLANYCLHRRLFFGTDGYIGLGPRFVRPGDRAYVLFGSRLPLVLRPVREGDDGTPILHFLGEAYVGGIMQGELVVAKEAEGIEPQIVKLV